MSINSPFPATAPVDESPDGPQSPKSPRGLLPSMAVMSLVFFAAITGLGQVLLPTQLVNIDAAAKVTNLALVTTISFVVTVIAQPLIGAISDRTRSRLGRRAPWMLIGAAIGGAVLLGVGSLTSIIWLTLCWVVIQVSLNAVIGPLSAIIPDRYPRERRGVASAMFGVGTTLGLTIGVILSGIVANQIGIGYSIFGIAIIIAAVLFVLINRDYSSKTASIEPFKLGRFLASFWISPRKHPDFTWAFVARFCFILGYFVILLYQLYILTDYIHLGITDAHTIQGLVAVYSLVTTLITVTLGGFWSDRLKRRKIFVYAASVLIALGMAAPLLFPSVEGMLLMGGISGLGFGLYTACDTALMTEVLPRDGASAGKDLSILNLATTFPQAVAAIVAALIIGTFGYHGLFVFSMIAVVLGGLALIPIRSVR
ncbi:MAG TPA: MFS transporter [Galbitalea sp.]|nr:MFS transporter [Galbitalea sp.]